MRKYRAEHPEVYYEWRKKKYHSDVNFKMSILLRNAIKRRALGIRAKPGSCVQDLGCTFEEFRAYIESKFKPGMTWENWSRRGWHLDHVRPLSLFDLNDPDQFRQAVHYTNMQPLWWHENISKGARFGDQQIHHKGGGKRLPRSVT